MVRWMRLSSTTLHAQEFVAANPDLVITDTSYAEEDYAIGMARFLLWKMPSTPL